MNEWLNNIGQRWFVDLVANVDEQDIQPNPPLSPRERIGDGTDEVRTDRWCQRLIDRCENAEQIDWVSRAMGLTHYNVQELHELAVRPVFSLELLARARVTYEDEIRRGATEMETLRREIDRATSRLYVYRKREKETRGMIAEIDSALAMREHRACPTK